MKYFMSTTQKGTCSDCGRKAVILTVERYSKNKNKKSTVHLCEDCRK